MPQFAPEQTSCEPVEPVPPSEKVTGLPVAESALPTGQLRTLRYYGSEQVERFEKRTEDRLDYVMDYSAWLDPNETITGVQGYTNPGDMLIDGLTYSPTRVLVWLKDGADNTRHEVALRTSTSRGKVMDMTFVVVTRTEPVTDVVVETVGTHAALTFPVRPMRRLTFMGGNSIDRQDKAEPETLDYWLDMMRWLDGDEHITAAVAWSDNAALQIPAVRFDDAWLVVWLGGGGFEARSNVQVQITTSRGRKVSYRMVLVSHGQPETPVYISGTPAQNSDIPVKRDREMTYFGWPQLERRQKHSGEILDYVLNLSQWLEPSETIVAAEAWPDPSTLRVFRLLFADTKVILWLFNGRDGQRYTVQLRVTTSMGKVVIFRFILLTRGDAIELLIIQVDDSTRTIGQIVPREPQPPEPVPVPVVQVTPVSLSFPDTEPGVTSASKQVQVSNAGTVQVAVRGMATTGDFAYSFDPVFALAPGESCPINLTFKPTAAGQRAGALQLDIGAGLQQVTTLAGNGVAIAGLRRLSTSGNQFVQSNGVPVRLKSINWFGAESENYTPHGTWGRAWRGIIDQIKTLGFNCIRLPFSGFMATNNPVPPSTAIDASSNPDLVGLTALEIFDRIINYCLTKEIYVVLDHHRRTAGAGADGSPVASGYTLADWKASWAVMANRYKDKVNVVGADVHNEPHDLTWNVWAGYVEDCGNYIHTIAPDWIIVCEGVGSDSAGGVWWGGALADVATRPVVLNQPGRLAYSPHEYGQSVGTQTWLAYDGQTPPAGWPNNLFAVWKAHWGFIFEQNIAPIWIGEFGGKYGVNGSGVANATAAPHGELEKLWTTTLCTYLNGDFTGDGTSDLPAGKQGISFAYWSLNPNSGDTGGMLMDDWQTVQTVKRNLINSILTG